MESETIREYLRAGRVAVVCVFDADSAAWVARVTDATAEENARLIAAVSAEIMRRFQAGQNCGRYVRMFRDGETLYGISSNAEAVTVDSVKVKAREAELTRAANERRERMKREDARYALPTREAVNA